MKKREVQNRERVQQTVILYFKFYFCTSDATASHTQRLLSFCKVLFPGCKESQFYSLPFGQAVASMYYPTSHFNQPQNPF